MHEQKCMLHSAYGSSLQSPTTSEETIRAVRNYEMDSMTRSIILKTESQHYRARRFFAIGGQSYLTPAELDEGLIALSRRTRWIAAEFR